MAGTFVISVRLILSARWKDAPRRWQLGAVVFMIAAMLAPGLAFGNQLDDFNTNRTTFGEVGLLEMPSARMAADGQIGLTFGYLEGAERFNFEFQATPWFEASFRYSAISNYAGFSTYYDRSFGLKLRLAVEGEYRPEISLGVRDLLGTGIYSSEYLVASKRFGDFDFSMGIGWGRLSDSSTLNNPLAQIFKSFEARNTSFGSGGSVNIGELFHGPKVGFFGGGAWHTPLDGVDLIVEYSSDRYLKETSVGDIKLRSPVNIGLAYHPTEFLSISGGWLYGSSYGASVSLLTNPAVPASLYRLGPKVAPPFIRSDQDQSAALSLLIDSHRLRPMGAPFVDIGHANDPMLAVKSALLTETIGIRSIELVGKTLLVDAITVADLQSQCGAYARVASAAGAGFESIAVSDIEHGTTGVAVCPIVSSKKTFRPTAIDRTKSLAAIQAGVAGQNLIVEAIDTREGELWIYFRNGFYYSESEAVGRIARVLMADAPGDIEVFHIVDVKQGVPMRNADISRSALERLATVQGSYSEVGSAISLKPASLSNPILDRALSGTYPRFHWAFGPNLREGFFDPDRPIEVELYGYAFAEVEFAPGLAADFRGEANIYNNYDFSRASNSQLPHVRSDVLEYYRQGINGITELDASYRTRLTPEAFVEVKAGILESMFTGAGAQVIWRPEGQRLTFGADIYEVWQRNFDRLLGVQNYHVLTGHVTVYYASPWYGLNFAAHAGRYLAGDYGGTFEVTRRFSTGVEVGAFATFTNVPFSKFGEGSFDKGILVRIPFEWGLPFYSQTTYDLALHSLTRDGGQRLSGDDSLYQDTEATSYDEMSDDIGAIAAP